MNLWKNILIGLKKVSIKTQTIQHSRHIPDTSHCSDTLFLNPALCCISENIKIKPIHALQIFLTSGTKMG